MEVGLDERPVALLVHGWNDDPTVGWFGWLTAKLEEKGYRVIAPHFEANAPHRFDRWRTELVQLSAQFDQRTIIVAHSLGTWLTLRLVEDLKGAHVFAGIFLVSGFFDAPRPEAAKFFEPEPNWSVVLPAARRWVAVYSDDDRIVTPDRTRRLAHKLQAELVCIPGHGHFLGSRGMNELPELLELIEGK